MIFPIKWKLQNYVRILQGKIEITTPYGGSVTTAWLEYYKVRLKYDYYCALESLRQVRILQGKIEINRIR